MARFQVHYQVINKGSSPSGPMSTTVSANGIYEAKQVFKASHVDSLTKKFKVLSAVKVG